ncbi:PepSY domain-containing protein [Bacillus tuaregi]|uniref:PepSY domain-containing protein n=1 Tax=Bacillus tuaregi TaxID=1816695 RepID=UPI0008F827CD|nr:PepSY domain-containing protein [Bacillus tuaregi]
MSKKILIGAVLSAVVLGGSIAAVAAKDDTTKSVADGKKSFITLEEAKAIALKEVDGRVESIDLETKVGKSYYEVEIEKDKMDYDIYIDAVTGEPYSVKQDDDDFDDRYDDHFDDDVRYDDDSKSISDKSKPTMEVITEAEAAAIAEKAVNGKIVEMDKEYDDGLLEYQFELHTDRGEAEVDIDAATGKVIEIDYDDRD